MFWQFCPEVSYDAFRLFASSLNRFADESDAGFMHEYLARIGADAGDPRWAWSSVAPMHYSDCPLYAPLASGRAMGIPAETAPVGGTQIALRSAFRWVVRGSTATAAVLKWAGSVLDSLSKLLHIPW